MNDDQNKNHLVEYVFFYDVVVLVLNEIVFFFLFNFFYIDFYCEEIVYDFWVNDLLFIFEVLCVFVFEVSDLVFFVCLNYYVFEVRFCN